MGMATELGVADLRRRTVDERAQALIEIAHPTIARRRVYIIV